MDPSFFVFASVRRRVRRASAHAATPQTVPTAKPVKRLTVARAMRLSPETGRTYVSRILTKLSATSRAQLVAIAHRNGLSGSGATDVDIAAVCPGPPD